MTPSGWSHARGNEVVPSPWQATGTEGRGAVGVRSFRKRVLELMIFNAGADVPDEKLTSQTVVEEKD